MSLLNIQNAQAGSYSVLVYNAYGQVVSNAAVITLTNDIVTVIIIVHPQSQIAASGSQVFSNLTRDIIPANRVLTDGWKALKATLKVLADEGYTSEQWMLAVTRAGLPIPQATLYPKLKYMTERDLDDLAR